jgi:hypothetical protein
LSIDNAAHSLLNKILTALNNKWKAKKKKAIDSVNHCILLHKLEIWNYWDIQEPIFSIAKGIDHLHDLFPHFFWGGRGEMQLYSELALSSELQQMARSSHSSTDCSRRTLARLIHQFQADTELH